MTIKIIEMEEREIKNLLTYLERNYRSGTFGVLAEGSVLLHSDLIVGDIKAMMAKISKQTGVVLSDEELPTEPAEAGFKPIRKWSKDGASPLLRQTPPKGK